jgi:two-component system, sensor histidine kinase and response regulator
MKINIGFVMDSQHIKRLKEIAKEKLRSQNVSGNIDPSGLSRKEIEKAFHDLQVYQIELEIQNEELINTQSQLMQLSEKYQFLYHDAPVGYLTIGMDGLVNEANKTFVQMLGLTNISVNKKSIRNWIPQEDSLIYYDHRRKLIDTRQPQTFKVQMLRQNKTLLPVQITLKLDDELHPKQMLMIVLDETEFKNIEDAHQTLVDHSAQGMWIFREKKLVFNNRRACEILGCNQREWVGLSVEVLLSMIDPENRNAFLEYFDNAPDLPHWNNPTEIKFMIEEREIWLELYGSLSIYKGQQAVQFTFVNITERKIAGDKLKKSEAKLRELNATKDRFFSIIAHDLKNPFNSIIGFTDLLLEDYHGFDDEERLHMISRLKESADNAFKLLDNLLKWSKIQINGIEQNPSNLQLRETLNETIELLKPSINNKNIRLVNDINSDIGVFADRDMLESIVRNLLTNAIKYSWPGGRIFLNAVSDEKSKMVTICIRDTGTGMSKEVQDKLFRIDYKTSTNGTSGEQGTGLGLMLCKEFVNLSGGRIWVNSDPGINRSTESWQKQQGGGSEFCFTLPTRRGT